MLHGARLVLRSTSCTIRLPLDSGSALRKAALALGRLPDIRIWKPAEAFFAYRLDVMRATRSSRAIRRGRFSSSFTFIGFAEPLVRADPLQPMRRECNRTLDVLRRQTGKII